MSWIAINWIIKIISVGIIIYDIWLASQKRLTISEWYQTLFPPTIDWIIGLGGGIGFCFLLKYLPQIDANVFMLWELMWGHIWIANRERYGEK